MKLGIFDYDDEQTPISRLVDWWMGFLVTRVLPLFTFVMVTSFLVVIVCAVLEAIWKQSQ